MSNYQFRKGDRIPFTVTQAPDSKPLKDDEAVHLTSSDPTSVSIDVDERELDTRSDEAVIPKGRQNSINEDVESRMQRVEHASGVNGVSQVLLKGFVVALGDREHLGVAITATLTSPRAPKAPTAHAIRMVDLVTGMVDPATQNGAAAPSNNGLVLSFGAITGGKASKAEVREEQAEKEERQESHTRMFSEAEAEHRPALSHR